MFQNDDILQARLAQIQQLPEPERSQAIAELTRDYPGLEKQLMGDQRFGEEMAMTPTPAAG